MAHHIYALLVGINSYDSPGVSTLKGCLNDIDLFANYLKQRAPGDSLKLKVLKEAEATREAVIQGFKTDLGSAGPGDVVVFYYSGHGSQAATPPELWMMEPDHLNETLVLYDSRNPGVYDLADKEMAGLISELAAKGPHICVILDCCHSGSGTREVGTTVRRAPADHRARPLESFLFASELVQSARATRATIVPRPEQAGPTAWKVMPAGRHVLFAACQNDQEAKEYQGDGQHWGAFSYFLGQALQSASGVPTYRDLFDRTSAGVLSSVLNQSPQLETTQNEDLNAVFLDGAIQAAPAHYSASFHGGHWVIDGGATAGIPAATGDDYTRLALYPFDARAADLLDTAKAQAMAKVNQVQPASSRLVIEGGVSLDPKATYKAILVSLPTPRLAVLLEGDAAACLLVRQALKTASPEMGPSLFVHEAAGQDLPDFRLVARAGQYVITRPGDERPIVSQIEGLTREGATLAVARLEHLSRWTQTARLRNPASSIKPGDLTMTILVNDQEMVGQDLRLEYQVENNLQKEPEFQVRLTNHSQRTLYCGLLDLTQHYGVAAGLLPAGCVKLEPGETVGANSGEPLTASIPDEDWSQGVLEFNDLLKLIVCTEEFDCRLLEQPDLDRPRPEPTAGASKSVGARGAVSRNGSLNHLLHKVQTRNINAKPPTVIDDWLATEVSFTTVRPLQGTPLPAAGQAAVTLTGGVQLEAHAGLTAVARLFSAPLASRDLNSLSLPRLLFDDPRVCQPLEFQTSRGTEPGLSVLELTHVNDVSVVTPEAPLRLTVPVPLQTHEHVLPLAYDGEFFLPLGRVVSRTATETVIALDRLTPPIADTRSVGGAIKIFFQKVIGKTTGLEYVYPILGAAEVSATGAVTQVKDPASVKQRVAQAQRIVLYVHGITGETQTMVPSVQLGKLANGQPLASLYDLVLTYDYENLNTTIEENGRLLKERLAAVGLGAGHGKQIDIVAHSMGGLVSRWFIEREGGNQMVRRLVMLGTPNGGSPWPKVVDWATVAMGLALNHLTVFAWPASALAGLSAMAENPTVALNEMLSTSKVLADLKASPDPGIPYFLVAGNTSIIEAATQESDPARKGSAFSRLVSRLTSPDLLHTVANPFFLLQPNDIAVSVTSMENLPENRKLPLKVQPAACDHLSYFNDQAGLKELASILASEP